MKESALSEDMGPEQKTYRFQMMWEPSMIEQIDDYCFANRIRTRAEGVRSLIKRGLGETGVDSDGAEGLATQSPVAGSNSAALASGASITNG